jgi:hypothetical protein
MTSFRENPIRRQPSRRPSWLLPVAIVGGVLVAVAVLILIVRVVGGSGGEDEVAEATPEPSCSTVMVAPGDELPLPKKTKVNVYNATETSGLASKTARDLKKRGFVIKEIANDPAGLPIEGVARIRYGSKGAKRAELLSYYFPGAELVELDRSGTKVDLALGDSFTFIPPQPDIDAALNTKEAVRMGPGCFSSATDQESDATVEDAPAE